MKTQHSQKWMNNFFLKGLTDFHSLFKWGGEGFNLFCESINKHQRISVYRLWGHVNEICQSSPRYVPWHWIALTYKEQTGYGGGQGRDWGRMGEEGGQAFLPSPWGWWFGGEKATNHPRGEDTEANSHREVSEGWHLGSGAPLGFTEDESRQRGWVKGEIADALAWPPLSDPLTWPGKLSWKLNKFSEPNRAKPRKSMHFSIKINQN